MDISFAEFNKILEKSDKLTYFVNNTEENSDHWINRYFENDNQLKDTNNENHKWVLCASFAKCDKVMAQNSQIMRDSHDFMSQNNTKFDTNNGNNSTAETGVIPNQVKKTKNKTKYSPFKLNS